MDSYSICDEHDFCDEGYCLTCGVSNEIVNFGHNSDVSEARRSKEPTAAAIIRTLGYSSNIEDVACRICAELAEQNNGQSKKNPFLVFASLIYAHRELRVTVEPRDIADKVGIKYREMNKSITKYPYIGISFHEDSPEDFVKIYIEKLEWDSTIKKMALISIPQKIRDMPQLQEKKPQCVAAAMILHFMSRKGISYDKEEFSEIVNQRIEGSMTDIFKLIQDTD